MLKALEKYNPHNLNENPFIKSKASWIWNYDITERPTDDSNINEYVEIRHEFHVNNTDIKSTDAKDIDGSHVSHV